jgi:acetyl esterase
MPLDPQAKAMLEMMESIGAPPLHTLSAPAAREQVLAQFITGAAPTPVAAVENRTIPGPAGALPVRIYTPEGTGPFPLMVFFHGSGFVVCNLDTHDEVCRHLCNGSGCVVVSVDYRLAPENKFPAAPDDCLTATRWAAEHAAEINADPARLVVAGDSAGGNLATVTALRIRDEGGPQLRGQLLIYPVTDYHTPPTPSCIENAEGYFLTRDDMIWFWGHYLNDETEAANPYVCPLRAPDLRGLPPALVITAGYDPLRDEGERYAARLQEADVPTTLSRYDGMFHGFFNMIGLIDQAQRGVDEACVWVQSLWT